MKRANIYLGEAQSAAVEDVARAGGISRAELIRPVDRLWTQRNRIGRHGS
jgi:hypothetical protein